MASPANPILDEIRQGNRLRPTKTVDKSKPAFLRDKEKAAPKKPRTKKARSAQPGAESDENTVPPARAPSVAPPPPPCLLSPPEPGMKRASSNPALSKLGGGNPGAIDRDEFLNSIKGGVKLRKAETKDKSGLIVDDEMKSGEPLVQVKPAAAPPPPPPSGVIPTPPAPGEKRQSANKALSKLGGKTAQQVDLGEFLNSIKGGVKLRKAETKDKSGLIVDETMLHGGLFKKEEKPGEGSPAPPPPPPCMAPPPPPIPNGVPPPPPPGGAGGGAKKGLASTNPALCKLGGKTAKDVDMGELLNNIKGGIRLRKTETKDKSGLIVDETMLQGGLFQKKEDGPAEINIPDISISAPAPPPPPPPMAPPPPPADVPKAPPPKRVIKEVNNPALKKLGGKTAADVDMGELLNNIKGGIRLKKVETKDRSGLIVDDTMTSGKPLVRIDADKLEAAKPKPKVEEEIEISEEDAAALLDELDKPTPKPEKKTEEPPPEPKKSDFVFEEKNLHISKDDIQKEIPKGKALGMRALWDTQIAKAPSPAPMPQPKYVTSYLKRDDKPQKARTPDPEPVTAKPKMQVKKNTDVLKEIKRLRNEKLKRQDKSEDVPELSEADAEQLLNELDAEQEEEQCMRLQVPERGRAMSTPPSPKPDDEHFGFDEKSLHVTKEDLEKEIPTGKAGSMRALFDQPGVSAPQFLNNQPVAPAPRVRLSDFFVRKTSPEPVKKKADAPVQRKKRTLKKQDSDFDMPELSEADAAALLEELDDLENSDEEKSKADACYDEKSLHVTADDLKKEIPSGKASGIRAIFDQPSTSTARSVTPEPLSRGRPRVIRESFIAKDDSDSEVPVSDADLVGDLGKITREELQEEIPSGVAAKKIAMWAGRESETRELEPPRRPVGRLQTPEILTKADSTTTLNGHWSKDHKEEKDQNENKKGSRWAPVQTQGLARPAQFGDRPRGSSVIHELPERPTTPSLLENKVDDKKKVEKKPTQKLERKNSKTERNHVSKTKAEETKAAKVPPSNVLKKEEAKVSDTKTPETVDEPKPRRTLKKKKIEASPVPMMSFAVEPKKAVVDKVASQVPNPTTEPSKGTAEKKIEPKVEPRNVEEVKKPVATTTTRKLSETGKKKLDSMSRKRSSEERPKLNRKDSKRGSRKKSNTERPKVTTAATQKAEEVKPRTINPALNKAKETFGGGGGKETSAEQLLRPTPRPFFLTKKQPSTDQTTTSTASATVPAPSTVAKPASPAATSAAEPAAVPKTTFKIRAEISPVPREPLLRDTAVQTSRFINVPIEVSWSEDDFLWQLPNGWHDDTVVVPWTVANSQTTHVVHPWTDASSQPTHVVHHRVYVMGLSPPPIQPPPYHEL